MQFPMANELTFQTNIRQAVYTQNNQVLTDSGLLAPLAGPTLPGGGYFPGVILAQYNLNAPSPSLVGQFVNYYAASTNADQAKPVAILVDQDVANYTSIFGNTVYQGGGGGWFKIMYLQPPLIISGAALNNANNSADVTAFLSIIPNFLPVIGSTMMSNSYNASSIPGGDQLVVLTAVNL